MKNKFKFKFLIFLFLIFITTKVYSQISDFQSWNSVAVEKEFNFGLTATITEEFRFEENMSKIDKYFTDAGLEYKITKFMDIGAAYRLVRDYKNSGDKIWKHRFDVNCMFDFKVKRLKFDYRIQYQNDNENLFSEDVSAISENNIRNRMRVKFDFKNCRINPYLSSEIFYQINKNSTSEFSKIRNSVGFGYEFLPQNNIDFYLMIETELNKLAHENYLILGLSYKYCFKK